MSKSERKMVVATLHQLLRVRGKYIDDATKTEVVMENCVIERAYIERFNAQKMNSGKMYVIDDDKTDEYYENAEAENKIIAEAEDIAEAGTAVAKEVLKSVAKAKKKKVVKKKQ